MKKINQIEPALGKEEKKALNAVIDSGWYTEAEKTREFEKRFAKFVGCKYASAVTSGTVALYVGLKALGIGKGDEVIVPDLTFVASPNAIEMTGAKPILIDIEPITLTLDLTKIPHLITKRTKAIMPVDLNGRSTNMKKLCEFTKKRNIFLIEDAAQAIGSYYNGKHVGNYSEVTAFSFSIPKIITTAQGGMIVTNNKEIHEKCLSIKDFGRPFGIKKDIRRSFEHKTIGYNFKFTEFQAAIGIAQMSKLKTRITKKKKMFAKYKEELSHIKEIEFIETNLKNITVWSADIILRSYSLRNRLIRYLKNRNIGTSPFFPPIHSLRPYKRTDTKFQVCSNISERGLYLPSSVSLTNNQIDVVCREINKFFI